MLGSDGRRCRAIVVHVHKPGEGGDAADQARNVWSYDVWRTDTKQVAIAWPQYALEKFDAPLI